MPNQPIPNSPIGAPSEATAPITVASLARALHEQDREGLEIAVPPDSTLELAGTSGVTVQDGLLRFATLADRNRFVAADALARLGEDALDPDALFAAAALLWRHEISHEDTACARLLAAVHTKGNVLAMAAEHIPRAESIWNVLHIVEKTLPMLPALDWPSLIALCEAQHPRTRGDGAAGVFFGVVRRWLIAHPGTGEELTALLLTQPTETLAELLQAAWLAWATEAPAAAAERAYAVGSNGSPPLPQVTGWVAETLLEDPQLPAEAVAALESLVLLRLQGATPEERKIGVRAATQVMHQRRRFDAALRTLAQAQAEDGDTVAYLAYALAQHRKALQASGLFFEWLPACAALSVNYGNAIGRLDHALSELLSESSPERDRVLAFLEEWITKQEAGGEFSETFTSCASSIRADAPLLRRVLTLWFGADSPELPHAAAGVAMAFSQTLRPKLQDTTAERIAFEPALLDGASQADLLFLARRLLGNLFDPDLLLRLALSLLHVRDAKKRVHPMMVSLLGDEIGYDFPSTTVDRLDRLLAGEVDPDTRTLLEGIRDRLKAYLANLDALPRLRELRPPAALQRAFWKARAKQQEGGMRQGRAESFLAQFVTQVHLKAGRSMFQYAQGRFTQPMVLKETSVSFELPRREVLDPVGNAFRLHQHRTAQRGMP